MFLRPTIIRPSNVRAISLLLALTGLGCSSGGGQKPSEEIAGSARRSGPPLDTSAVRASASLDGIDLELILTPLESKTLVAGTNTRIEFRITDAATGLPLSGVFPAAWIDAQEGQATSEKSCVDKVEMFLGGSLFSRADLDLNIYHVLAMNDDATLTVVDPQFGFGGTKLLELVQLPSPGEDWDQSRLHRQLYVTSPEAGKLTVVRTTDFQIGAAADLPGTRRVLVQPDSGRVWADWTTDDPKNTGIAALNPSDAAITAKVTTGQGPHAMAIDDDGTRVFVTNRADDSVSIISTDRPRELHRLATGREPIDLAWSSRAQALYVAHHGEGTVVAFGKDGRKIATMAFEPGIEAIHFEPGGRFGFVLNPGADRVWVFDVATNREIHRAEMQGGPDQVVFSDELAYVRRRDTAEVLMIPLSSLGSEGQRIQVVDFPGGQLPFADGRRGAAAMSFARPPGAAAILVANPADEAIYFYMEGMAAPMGSFRNYGRQPRAVAVADNSLSETSPGRYTSTARLPIAPGVYDVLFFVDAPRSIRCFEITVNEHPKIAAAVAAARPKAIVKLIEGGGPQTPGPATLVVDVHDRKGENAVDVDDLELLVYDTSGRNKYRTTTSQRAPGRYVGEVQLHQPGVYGLWAISKSTGLVPRGTPVAWLEAVPATEQSLP